MIHRIHKASGVIAVCLLYGIPFRGYAQPGGGAQSPQADGDSVQFSIAVAGGMGITAIAATDLVDYINATTLYAHRLDDFSSAAEFFGNIQLRWTDSWGGKLEYVYLINSHNIISTNGTYDYSYVIHMPMAIVQYLDMHTGYAFKFGAGIGYHVALLSEQLQGTAPRNSTSRGVGIKVEGEANTVLDEHLYVYIGGDMRFSIMGAFKDSNGSMLPILTGSGAPSSKNASMDFFALGLKFGLIYYF